MLSICSGYAFAFFVDFFVPKAIKASFLLLRMVVFVHSRRSTATRERKERRGRGKRREAKRRAARRARR